MPAKSTGSGLREITPQALKPLGFLYELDLGDGRGIQVWHYVQNGDVADWVPGTCVGRKDGAPTKVGVRLPVNANLERAMGFAQQLFPVGFFGYILRTGDGLVLADNTGITANTGLVPSGTTIGTLDSAVAPTAGCVAWAHTAIAPSVAGRAFVNARG